MASARKRKALGDAKGPAKVMIIRHGEKPDGISGVLGVDETGREDPDQLSVRGWHAREPLSASLLRRAEIARVASPRLRSSLPASLTVFQTACGPSARSRRWLQRWESL
jgi:hypothetical protein